MKTGLLHGSSSGKVEGLRLNHYRSQIQVRVKGKLSELVLVKAQTATECSVVLTKCELTKNCVPPLVRSGPPPGGV